MSVYDLLDTNKILDAALDKTTGRLKVSAEVTSNTSGAQEIVISHADDSIRLGDGTNLTNVTSNGELSTHDADLLSQLQSLNTKVPTLNQDISDSALLVKEIDRTDKSMFGNTKFETIHDHISIKFVDSASIDTLCIDTSTTTGTATISNASMVLSSGTNPAGRADVQSKNKIVYNAGHECGAKFTAVFEDTAADCIQRIGIISDDESNGAYIERGSDGIMYCVHLRAGSVIAYTPQSSWNGELSTKYTLNGNLSTYSPYYGRVYRVRFGYLGYAGIIYEVRSPDGNWITMHTINYETATQPIFNEVSLPIRAIVENQSGSTSASLTTASWEGYITGQNNTVVCIETNTTTPLTAGATFVGGWCQTHGYTSIQTLINTDQVSATNGIKFEFSDRSDAGATVKTTKYATFSSTDITAGFKMVILEPRLAFFRITYVNGGVDQTSLSISSVLHSNSLALPREDIESVVSSSHASLMTRNITFAKKDDGTYSNITQSDLGGLRVAVTEHEVETPIKALTSWSTNQATVGTTAVQIVSSPLTGRKTVLIKNNSGSNKVVYVGNSSAVTTSNGYELAIGEAVAIDIDDTVTGIWAIAGGAGQSLSWLQVGG